MFLSACCGKSTPDAIQDRGPDSAKEDAKRCCSKETVYKVAMIIGALITAASVLAILSCTDLGVTSPFFEGVRNIVQVTAQGLNTTAMDVSCVLTAIGGSIFLFGALSLWYQCCVRSSRQVNPPKDLSSDVPQGEEEEPTPPGSAARTPTEAPPMDEKRGSPKAEDRKRAHSKAAA